MSPTLQSRADEAAGMIWPDNISLLDVNGRKGPEEQEEAPTLDWIASC